MNSTTIAIIGQGRVATHFRLAFADSANVIPVNSRSLENLPAKADLYIIAVSDGAIREVAERLSAAEIDGTTVHTSGSTPLSIFSGLFPDDKVGILYPLQTFSHGVAIDYSRIPFFVVTDDKETCEKLKQICSRVSINVYQADSDMLGTLHLAAVFACNFTNAMICTSEEILSGKGMNYSILLPLLRETVDKLESVSPREAQTGPARRNDVTTINRHRMQLKENNPDLLPIYDAVTAYIAETTRK